MIYIWEKQTKKENIYVKNEKRNGGNYEVLNENEISFFKNFSGGCAPRPRAPRPPAGGHLASLVV
jgi:hypothetical protein